MSDSSDDKTRRVAIVTGGTRGIGAGLVRAFAEAGWQVHFTGRSETSVREAMDKMPIGLATRISGQACMADDAEALARVWGSAAASGRVEVVLCNAGVSHPRPDFDGYEMDTLRDVVTTNIIGPMTAALVFLPRLEAQGGGFFYAMEGLGSRGEIRPGSTLYATTKYALAYFLRALARENKGSAVSIGALSPGMVVTDLLLADSGGLSGLDTMSEKRKKIFTILADKVETVAPWLVERVIADVKAGPRPGRYRRFAWLTAPKVFARFLSSAFIKRRVFD